MRALALPASLILAVAPCIAQAENLEDLLVKRGVITRDELKGVPEQEDAKIYWSGGTRIDLPASDFGVQLNTLLQPRYEYIDIDEDLGGDESSFRLNAARLLASGNMLGKEFNYRLEGEFIGSRSADGQQTPTMLDGYLQWNPCPWFNLRAGQYKTAIGRQFVTGNAFQQLPDRSFVSETFRINYQPGLRGTFSDPDKRYSFFAGVFNGESTEEGNLRGGRNFPGADNKMLGETGVRANIFGMQDPYVDADTDFTQQPALNAGLAYSYSDAENDFGDGMADSDFQRANFDINFKYLGTAVHGEMFWADFENELAGESEPVGGYLQAGYLFTKNWEVVGRYAYADCDSADIAIGVCRVSSGAIDIAHEASAGFNYYFWKQNLKAQLAYTFLKQEPYDNADEDSSDLQSNRWILQLSAWL